MRATHGRARRVPPPPALLTRPALRLKLPTLCLLFFLTCRFSVIQIRNPAPSSTSSWSSCGIIFLLAFLPLPPLACLLPCAIL